jgi:hypothetical protein
MFANLYVFRVAGNEEVFCKWKVLMGWELSEFSIDAGWRVWGKAVKGVKGVKGAKRVKREPCCMVRAFLLAIG